MEEGTIIRLSYDMWLDGVDELFDTTDRDRASESGIFDPQHAYGPIVAVVGAGRLVPGLEAAIKATESPGGRQEITLKPEEAFGPRDPKKIDQVPMQRFKQSKVVPKVGERIQYKNRPATISRVAGGRVSVDTNSPLAGRDVRYSFEVEEVIEDPKAQVAALIEMGYRRDVAFDVDVKKDSVEILVPDQVKYDQHWPITKFRIAHDLGQYTDFETVRFVEVFDTRPKAPEGAPAEGADAHGEAATASTDEDGGPDAKENTPEATS